MWMGGIVRRTRDKVSVLLLAAVIAGVVPALGAQAPCVRLDTPYWQVGASRFLQISGSGQRQSGVVIERHFTDRRILRRSSTGYRMEIARTRLGLTDATLALVADFDADGRVVRVTGDPEGQQHDLAPLTVLPCADLQRGRTMADAGGRVDVLRSAIQRGTTRSVPARPVSIGAALDTIGERVTPLAAERLVADTSDGDMLRQLPGQATSDTVHPWSRLEGIETERQLVRVRDGAVVFRERSRQLAGRGWVPPHDLKDTVPLRVESALVERLVDSAHVAAMLAMPRRGERSVSGGPHDTVAVHFREWRGDTLILRQFRRTGWRDELRTVWRESALAGALLTEPGTATQPPGITHRPFGVARGYLRDAGARDSLIATPEHAWSLALDGYEDAIIPALLLIPADSQPHRFSMYALAAEQGGWLHWTVSVAARGSIRVAKLVTLQKQWLGTFIYTDAGELLLANLGGPGGVTRVPSAGTRLDQVWSRQRANVKREDLIGAPAAAPPRP